MAPALGVAPLHAPPPDRFRIARLGRTVQAPVPQSPIRDPENLITFTTWDAEIRKVNGHWELWAGAVKLKDLGNREADAREVLRLIRLLNVNQFGTVGKPLPVMEYWLSD